jgi:hypothetical protein
MKSGIAAKLFLCATGILLAISCRESTSLSFADSGDANSPYFTSQPPTTNANGGKVFPGCTYRYQITAKDPAANTPPTLASVALPTGATFVGDTITWTPEVTQENVAQGFSIKAMGTKGTSYQSWSITPQTRTAPSITTLNPALSPMEGRPYSVAVTFTDDDPSTCQWTVTSPAEATFDAATASLHWTAPAGSAGQAIKFDFGFTNSIGQSATSTFTTTVIAATGPTMKVVGTIPTTASEGIALSIPISVVAATGSTLPATPVVATATYLGTTTAAQPSVVWDAAKGQATITWTPTVNDSYRNQTVSINLTGTDSYNAKSYLTILVKVIP